MRPADFDTDVCMHHGLSPQCFIPGMEHRGVADRFSLFSNIFLSDYIYLAVSLDELVFNEADLGPGERIKLLIEAVEQLNQDEQQVIQELLEGMVMNYQIRHWDSARSVAK
jgi:hypothetical protein